MSQLKTLLLDLGRSRNLQAKYEEDPVRIMTDYGLSSEEIEAMTLKDCETIKKLANVDTLLTNGNIRIPHYEEYEEVV